MTEWEEKNKNITKKYNDEINNKMKEIEQLRTDMETLSTKITEIKTKSKHEIFKLKKKMEDDENEIFLLKKKETADNEKINKIEEELKRIQRFNQQRNEQIIQSERNLRNNLDAALEESHRTQEQLRSIKTIVKQAEIKMKRIKNENKTCREEHEAMSFEIEQKEIVCIELNNQILNMQRMLDKDVEEEKVR